MRNNPQNKLSLILSLNIQKERVSEWLSSVRIQQAAFFFVISHFQKQTVLFWNCFDSRPRVFLPDNNPVFFSRFQKPEWKLRKEHYGNVLSSFVSPSQQNCDTSSQKIYVMQHIPCVFQIPNFFPIATIVARVKWPSHVNQCRETQIGVWTTHVGKLLATNRTYTR